MTERLEVLLAEVKQDLERKIGAMREKRDEAYAEFRELKPSSGQAWTELKSGVESAVEELSRAYQIITSC